MSLITFWIFSDVLNCLKHSQRFVFICKVGVLVYLWYALIFVIYVLCTHCSLIVFTLHSTPISFLLWHSFCCCYEHLILSSAYRISSPGELKRAYLMHRQVFYSIVHAVFSLIAETRAISEAHRISEEKRLHHSLAKTASVIM